MQNLAVLATKIYNIETPASSSFQVSEGEKDTYV